MTASRIAMVRAAGVGNDVAVPDGSEGHEAKIPKLQHAADVIIAAEFVGRDKRSRLQLEKNRVNKAPAVSKQHINANGRKDFIGSNPTAS